MALLNISVLSARLHMIGEVLAHYRILEKIGEGGMGAIYRARDDRLGRDVALKVLPPEAESDESARARLLQEARAASALNHPHVCTIYDVGQVNDRAYIAMELVEGRELRSLLVSGPLPVETVLRYGAQIADALDHAHERGVIHRDLKSSNVMITMDSRAKVLDFGIARRLQEAELDAATQSRVSLAEAGGIAGTLHYMAPEVLRGQSADARNDIWALGVVLHEIAAGDLPFKGRTAFELSSAILYEPPGPLPARLPAGLRGVILRCLAKELGQRYRSAGEVRAALEALAPEAAVILPAPRSRASRRMLYKVRATLRGKWKGLALQAMAPLFGGIFFLTMMGLARLLGLGHDQDRWSIGGMLFLALTAAAVFLGALILSVKRWSFVVYPGKIRAQGRRRSIDIPFDQIQKVELISFPVWSLRGFWAPFKMSGHYAQLGTANMIQLWGLVRVIRIDCGGTRWRKGYYLDVDQPEKFLDALNRALERYRALARVPKQMNDGSPGLASPSPPRL